MTRVEAKALEVEYVKALASGGVRDMLIENGVALSDSAVVLALTSCAYRLVERIDVLERRRERGEE